MNYKEFIKGFSKATEAKKASYIEKHIIKKYLPYSQKIAEAKEIIERCNYVEIQEKRTYKKDSPMTYLLFVMRIIANYTDIECEQEEAINMFDALNECGLIDYIISALPQREYQEFQTVLSMVQDDENENFRSLAGFLDTKMESISILLDALVEAASEQK